MGRRNENRGTTPYIDVDATLLLAFGAVQTAILNIAIGGRKPEAKPLEVLPRDLAERQFLLKRIDRRRQIMSDRQFQNPRRVLLHIQRLEDGHR